MYVFLVLKPPLNVTVEMTSSIGTLLQWIAPPGSSEDVQGYKVSHPSHEGFIKLTGQTNYKLNDFTTIYEVCLERRRHFGDS